MPFHSLYALAFTMRPSQEFGVYWDMPFYSKEKGINAKLRKQNCYGTGKLIKKSLSCIYLGNREASQYLIRTREQVPPGRASIKITTKKTIKLDLIKKNPVTRLQTSTNMHNWLIYNEQTVLN